MSVHQAHSTEEDAVTRFLKTSGRFSGYVRNLGEKDYPGFPQSNLFSTNSVNIRLQERDQLYYEYPFVGTDNRFHAENGYVTDSGRLNEVDRSPIDFGGRCFGGISTGLDLRFHPGSCEEQTRDRIIPPDLDRLGPGLDSAQLDERTRSGSNCGEDRGIHCQRLDLSGDKRSGESTGESPSFPADILDMQMKEGEEGGPVNPKSPGLPAPDPTSFREENLQKEDGVHVEDEQLEGSDSESDCEEDHEERREKKRQGVLDDLVEVKLEPEEDGSIAEILMNVGGCEKRKKSSIGSLYNCPMCAYSTNKSLNLSRHKKSSHDRIRYPCNECDFTGTKRDHLNQHKKTKHLGIRYPCTLCDHQSSSPSSLRKHRKAKHDGVRYTCDLCDFTASQQGLIKRHKEAKHLGVIYYCDQCTYTGTCKSLVAQHRRNKHDGIRFPCELCGYMATKRSDLTQHKKRIHEKVKYYCDLCEYVCSSRAVLKHHKESQHDGITYLCEHCTYVSLSQNSLKKHVQTVHEGIRYPCEFCNYEATQKQNLDRHRKNSHGSGRQPVIAVM